jgi:amino acid transporter
MGKAWTDGAKAPMALKEHAHLRDPFRYRLKRKLLGNPINRHSLSDQRLSKKSAFGILSSDCISSSAYGGEQILVALIPAFGLAAFAIFPPMVAIILAMLLVITFSYRDVIATYTRTGSAYIVAKENFGTKVSLVAAIELMFGYIITVAIQSAAGVAAIISAFPELSDIKVEITLAVVVLLTFVNLRGVKDAGLIFVLPSYLFIFSMFTVFGFGIYRHSTGTLPNYATQGEGLLPLGESQGLISLAAALLILKAFANGSASLTGLEAVSDSVPLFKSPEHKNARTTLALMALTLGTLITGIAWLAQKTTAVPYAEGTPTVISLVAKAALGDSAFGNIFFYIVQAGTTFILFAGANTCYNAFPNLVSMVAKDGFLPKRLTQRGHRLAFSNGIIFIAGGASILVIVSGASITALAAIYALAVFVGFTITGLGMARKTLREKASGNRKDLFRLALHSLSGSIALITVIILSAVKFFEGTWIVVIGTPIVAALMLNFNRQYMREREALLLTASHQRATSIARHDVSVLVDSVDIATIGAIRYARSLNPRNLRAIHFVIDDRRAENLKRDWSEAAALSDVSLELIDCPDRRIPNAVVDYAIRSTETPDVELTLLLPRRAYSRFLGRLLHDQTAEEIARPISQLPRVVATIVPFDVDRILSGERLLTDEKSKVDEAPKALTEEKPLRAQSEFLSDKSRASHFEENITPIGEIMWRKRAHVQGHVTSMRSSPQSSAPGVEIEVWDETGGVKLQFLGRREIAGLEVGSIMRAEGMVGEHEGALTILNPSYELLN